MGAKKGNTKKKLNFVSRMARQYSLSKYFRNQNRLWVFFREIDSGHIVKCKQITNFTRFSENLGKNSEYQEGENMNIFE